ASGPVRRMGTRQTPLRRGRDRDGPMNGWEVRRTTRDSSAFSAPSTRVRDPQRRLFETLMWIAGSEMTLRLRATRFTPHTQTSRTTRTDRQCLPDLRPAGLIVVGKTLATPPGKAWAASCPRA